MPTLPSMFFLAEFYSPAGAALADLTERASAGAAEAAGGGTQIRFLQAILVPQDEICFALYQAQSAAEVMTAGSLSGLEFDRVAAAEVLDPMTHHGCGSGVTDRAPDPHP